MITMGKGGAEEQTGVRVSLASKAVSAHLWSGDKF